MMNKPETPLLDVRHLKNYFITGSGMHKQVVKAVDDVSFQVYRGETFGLVGESGCGKTTTGRTIIRLYTPTGGEVYFDGRCISGRMSKEDRRYLTRNMQMIFQDPIASLNPRMTIQEIIAEGLKVNGVTDRQEQLDRVYDILDKVGLTRDHATRYPHEFSGGQRQRVGIARALVMHPSFIIADEPVSALDVSIQAQVINLFNRLKQEMDLTILFIAHDLSVVKYFSDR
ncbi:MAG: ATP-binding cassette domain-containing protein, partial [Aristaeellaceae bacterium]